MTNNDARDAADQLRTLLRLLPDQGGQDTALRRRVEGAAATLGAISQGDDESPDS